MESDKPNLFKRFKKISFKKKIILSTIVIFILIIGTVAIQYLTLVKQADGLVFNKEYGQATKVYEQVLAEFDTSAVETKLSNARNLQNSAIEFELGMNHFDMKYYQDALDHFQKVIEGDSENYEIATQKISECDALLAQAQQVEQDAQAEQDTQIQQDAQADAQALLVSPSSQNIEKTVYITNSGNKYHRAECKYLSKSEIPIKKSEAINEGYTPCSVCNP